MSAVEFAAHLTRKGVYTFNIHDIRKYALEFDRDDILERANSTPTIRK